MKLKAVSGIMVTLLLISISSLAFNIQPVRAEPGTWTVDDDGPADFNTIQEAIDAASPGDTIYVYNGTYYENVVVDKSVALVGEKRETTVIDGNQTGTVIIITADNVAVSNFLIQNSGWHLAFGIYLYNSSSNTLSRNIVTNNIRGIHLRDSSNNTLFGNIVTNNGYGIQLFNSSSNTLSGNIITDNRYSITEGCAVLLCDSFNNNLSGNIVTNNIPYGIQVCCLSNNNTISGNNLTNNWYGIHLSYSSSNTLSGNIVTNSTQAGITLGQSSNNTLSGNIVTNSARGILLDSSDNTLCGNTVTDNSYGISIHSSNNLIFHNNFINNTNQVSQLLTTYTNTWDDGGEGNYWSDYKGVDYTGDGIGDTPYVIDENDRDNHPLMSPWTPTWHPTPLWMQWWFWTIIAAGIAVAIGTVYLLKKRKPPTPTAPTPPTEGTETSIE